MVLCHVFLVSSGFHSLVLCRIFDFTTDSRLAKDLRFDGYEECKTFEAIHFHDQSGRPR